MAASHTHDDGFREIQLNGKQLVFLFMAVTVVSVVIFLCGVLVGRNVRVEQRTVAQIAALNDVPAPDVVSAIAPGVGATAQAGGDPTKAAAPPPPADDLSYFNQLEKSTRPADNLKAAPSKSSTTNSGPPSTSASSQSSSAAAAGPLPDVRRPTPTPPAPARPPTDKPATEKLATDKPTTDRPATDKPPADKTPAAAVTALTPPATPAPASDGYAVQVAAVNVRGDADAIAKRLASKGYAAYVQAPPSGGKGSVFRVRVGTFKTRREADAVAARLQKEEQIKPWVTR